MAGDVFQLGNNSYRILRVERGTVRVEDAHGMPPTLPFCWARRLRSDELSRLPAPAGGARAPAMSRPVAARLRWLIEQVGLDEPAAAQLADYVAAAHAALGCLPTQDRDRARALLRRGRRHAAGHPLALAAASTAPGAWRCASASAASSISSCRPRATEDTIVLSLTTAHSFELAEVARYLHAATVRRC